MTSANENGGSGEGCLPYAQVDCSAAPIIQVRVVGPLTDPGFYAYQQELWAAFEAYDKFSVVLDSGSLQRMPVRYLAISSRWLREAVQTFDGRWVSTAFVVSNPVLRGSVAALFWTVRYEFELAVKSTYDEAMTWSRARLVERGVRFKSA